MHYVGQGFEIRVDLPGGPMTAGFETAAREAFHAAYAREYGYNDPGAPVEATDWYVVATVAGGQAPASLKLTTSRRGAAARIGTRRAWFPEAGGMVDCAVLDRTAMATGERFAGPALGEERESTTVVPPGDSVEVSAHDNLLITLGGAR